MAKVFESPLISHARMRALYRAMVEVRSLRGRLSGAIHGTEACLVSTAIDLQPDDLTSSADSEALPDYVRALAARTGSGAPSPRAVKRLLARTSVGFVSTGTDRLLCAVGMAMALKARTVQGVAVAYADATDLKAAEWTRVLSLAASAEVPLILVVTPGSRPGPRLQEIARRASPAGLMPVIPVDTSDAVALYRVAQESLVRARADRRAALIECVASKDDPIALLATQLTTKGICSARWLAGVSTSFSRVLPPVPSTRRRNASAT